MARNRDLPVVRTGEGGAPRYSDAVRKAVLEAIEQGCTRAAAAGAGGIHVSTLLRWIADDAAFRERVEIAEQKAERTMTLRLIVSANRHPGSALAWLERRRPAEWRERKTIEVSGPDGGPIQYRDYSDADLEAEIARLRGIANDKPNVSRAPETPNEVGDAHGPDTEAAPDA